MKTINKEKYFVALPECERGPRPQLLEIQESDPRWLKEKKQRKNSEIQVQSDFSNKAANAVCYWFIYTYLYQSMYC